MTKTSTTVYLAGDPAADDLLAANPFALLVGMQLDQQIPMEKAFSGPRVLTERLGEELTPAAVASRPLEQIEQLCAQPPAVHRFPRAAAARLHALAQQLVDEYDGDTAQLWATARTGAALVQRVAALPGFGQQKAKIFTALLGKQFGVRPTGWKKAAGDYGLVGHRSIADVVDSASRQRVRDFKKAQKAKKATTAQQAG